jgi:competence protein ComEA
MAKGSDRDRAMGITIGLMAVTAVAVVVILILGRPRPVKVSVIPPTPTSPPLPTSTPSPLTVYVTGAVVHPNTTHTLPHNSRVESAIIAAGGALENADLSRVNLTDILRDGAQIHVPELEATESAPPPTPIGGAKVNVNTANAEQLDSLPGIGPALAQRIIDYRTQNGPFASLDDLDNVDGIGPALLDALRDLVLFS